MTLRRVDRQAQLAQHVAELERDIKLLLSENAELNAELQRSIKEAEATVEEVDQRLASLQEYRRSLILVNVDLRSRVLGGVS